ncbi:DegT/DnrJ/EryC1/StrS family aminotransferase [Bacteroides thetaiotaomicron]|uniref:DegT/DnrJ/EryC1/StrS family aminotransferase n=1 Tax=Bacteroides thetaiotaomicron TaxID=818 RepID=A0AB38UER9_BACT4|nr:DegT/DnrJ/EryC1/StrS family aminotransferase [Bacteroides thetaiotaomicron]UYU91327.1 DegT/DnrJ/EryC1/StrS family aminotransferase [Bacteroides thetaiotaomicron]
MINVYQPTLGKEELDALQEVFESNWLGKGKRVAEFEEKYAGHLGTSKDLVLTTNCCSEGLFSSMHLLDIQPGDEVIVPAISFIGAGNAVCAHGAKLVLCDVDPRTLNARAEDIEKVITPKSKAILLLHYGGIPCEMNEIMALAKKYNLKVIEDAAAGVCSRYKGKAVGTIGDMGMWSFDAMKILVCGDGAMLHFNTPELRHKADRWLYFGLETKSGYENSIAQKWWEFDISSFGHRAIMNDVTAAMALEQLKKLPMYMEKRKVVADFYNQNLKLFSWIELPPTQPEYIETSYYFYHVQITNGKRDQFAKFLRESGVYTTYRYYPLHRVPGYGVTGNFPNADYAADNTLNLPIHQSISQDDLNHILAVVKEFDEKFC